MFGLEMTAQNDANAALAIVAADLVREHLFPTSAAQTLVEGARIEEAARRTMPAWHRCAARNQPHKECWAGCRA